MSVQLETFLLKTGLLTPSELEEAVSEASRNQVPLWDAIIGESRVSEETLADTFARWFNLPRVQIESLAVEPEAARRIDNKLARKYTCLPVKVEGKSLHVAVANPLDYGAIQDVEFHSGLNVRPLVATRTEILEGIASHYAAEERMADLLANVHSETELQIVASDKREDLDETDDPSAASAAEVAPVVKMCNLILHDAIKSRASDVHLEPSLSNMLVRLRVDGVLREYTNVPRWLHTPVVSRLKILASLDIAERRLPQDGRINVQFQGRPVDIRVSTLPTHFGEKVVLRILGSSAIPALDVMGLTAQQVTGVLHGLEQPQGMVIVTGPTGSGKSTTLYSMIERRKSPEVNIVTVEDPIEYQLPGINQVQVNARSGLTFASALRSILRQDPDIILVGEVRDSETAEIAFQAAVTGHLVLTTLHTNSSLATIARLLDLGVDPFVVSSSLNLVIAQRLARRTCPRCKEPYQPDPEVLERLRMARQSMVFRRGRGCSMCGNTGFAGRIGIYEVLRLTPAMKDLIHHRASESEMKAAATSGGTRFLMDEALRKVILGQTTPEEILRVIRLDEDQQEITTCPKCMAPTQPAFSTCPYCLQMLKRVCDNCGRQLEMDWKACPYCYRNGRPQLPVGEVSGNGNDNGYCEGFDDALSPERLPDGTIERRNEGVAVAPER